MPRALVYKVMEDFYHQQYGLLRALGLAPSEQMNRPKDRNTQTEDIISTKNPSQHDMAASTKLGSQFRIRNIVYRGRFSGLSVFFENPI